MQLRLISFLIILLGIMCGCDSISTDREQFTRHNLTQWFYRWGDSPKSPEGKPILVIQPQSVEWFSFPDTPMNPPGRDGEKLLWIQTRLPDKLGMNPAIHINSIDLSTEVYVNEKMIYRHGSFTDDGSSQFAGWVEHLIPLPKDAAGSVIVFRVWSDYTNIGIIGTPQLGDFSDLKQDMFFRSIPVLVLATISIVVSLAGLALTARKLKEREYAFFALWAIALAVYFVVRIPVRRELGFDLVFASGAEVFSPGICAIGALGFIDATTKPLRFWPLRILTVLLALFISGVTFCWIIGLVPLPMVVAHNNIALLAAIPIAVLVLAIKASKGDRQAQILILGFSILSATAILDILVSQGLILKQLSGKFIFIYAGTLALIASFVYLIIRRFSLIQKDLIRHKRVMEVITEEGKNIAARLSLAGLDEQIQDSLAAVVDFPIEVKSYFSPSTVLDISDADTNTLYPIDQNGRSLLPDPATFAGLQANWDHVLPVKGPMGFHHLAVVCVRFPQGGNLGCLTFFEPLLDHMGSALAKVQLKRTSQLIAKQRTQLQLKTRDLSAILKSIGQGILIVNQRMKIMPEYSSFVLHLFKTESCVGQDFVDFFFKQTRVASDIVARCRAALEACLNDTPHSFALNKHIFPTELTLVRTDDVRVLELDWTPIIEADSVKAIMVTFRDATDIRYLHETRARQEREKEVLLELITVPPQDIDDFIDTTHAILQECFTAAQSYDMDAWRTIHTNLHTIKGNARILSFNTMASAVHDTESRVAELPALHSDDLSTTFPILETIRETLDFYKNMIDHQRHRTDEERLKHSINNGVRLARHVLKEQNLVGTSLANEAKLVYRQLMEWGFHTLNKILLTCLRGTQSTAERCGVPQPKLDVQGDMAWVLERECALTLQGALTQFFRNSITHGFIDGREGIIAIKTKIEDNKYTITYQDNGRGLDLPTLRQSFGPNQQELSDEKVAKVIFTGRVSTATHLTEEAGRGVGMAAAKDRLEAIGIQVELKLVESPDLEGFRPFSIDLHLLSRHVVETI